MFLTLPVSKKQQKWILSNKSEFVYQLQKSKLALYGMCSINNNKADAHKVLL